MAIQKSRRKRVKTKSSSPKKCHFFTLPVELRLKIYSLALESVTIDPLWAGGVQEPPLLQVSRLIREESVDVLNKCMSAILDNERSGSEAAKSAMETSKREYRRSLTYDDLQAFWRAECFAGHCRGALLDTEQAVNEKRRRLRLEGFRI